ncbi:hypothetical protein EUGRSUZ_B03846 [Eucalyptus grandis]|uniref:Uncharacterized protein n=2 Tax=Eucalyptus grandis TaxID=71139 RepID=A0ACC3LZG5_EUCGR|nr:hypothetical protein EUGRSUZ_B03846 [Eucalyptus grandis]
MSYNLQEFPKMIKTKINLNSCQYYSGTGILCICLGDKGAQTLHMICQLVIIAHEDAIVLLALGCMSSC